MSEFSEASAPDPGVPAHFWRSIGRRLVGFFGWGARPCTRFCSFAWPGAALGLIAAALFFPTFDPGRMKQIRFCFDRTRTAAILLDDVRFTPGPAPIQN